MGNPNDAATLAGKFEPILLFHPNENFFPIDPKWYLERCALWRATPAFDDKANWGQPPQIAKGMIAALNGAKELAGGKTWLGQAGADFGVASLPINSQQPPPTEEHFLEFVGWEPVAALPVTPTTDNRHAALQPSEYAVALENSYPWYYVEYLDNNDLMAYTANPNIATDSPTNTPNLFKTVANNSALNMPRMILYHVFYPLHQEALEGCEKAGQGQVFGTYAGEWSCIALLLDQAGAPLFIGITSRNTGNPAIVAHEDHRIGMTVFDWKDVQSVKDPVTMDLHPKIFVSLGTHGYYLNFGTQTLTPFTPGGVDPASMSCGQVETLDGVISGDIVTIPGSPYRPSSGNDLIIITKMIAGFLGGLEAGFLGAVGGTIGGAEWAVAEGAWYSFGNPATPDTLASPTPQPTDTTGGPNFGRIIRPKSLAFAEVSQATSLTDWNVKAFNAPAPDGRSYPFVVDRSTQVWWAPRPAPRKGTNDLPNPDGFTGRWGPRVSNDPFTRRAGMECPDFALMFLDALAVKLNT